MGGTNYVYIFDNKNHRVSPTNNNATTNYSFETHTMKENFILHQKKKCLWTKENAKYNKLILQSVIR